jgi:hypothetical protein
VKRRQQCVGIVEKTIAVAVSRLMDRVFASHPRLKPGAKCCRSFAAKHNPKQRTKTCVIPSDVHPQFFLTQDRPRGAMILNHTRRLFRDFTVNPAVNAMIAGLSSNIPQQIHLQRFLP